MKVLRHAFNLKAFFYVKKVKFIQRIFQALHFAISWRKKIPIDLKNKNFRAKSVKGVLSKYGSAAIGFNAFFY